ncbi:MAG TPA: hypothetical protein P5044_02845 [bacterium]|nr:hypothetical protein [bacterium]
MLKITIFLMTVLIFSACSGDKTDNVLNDQDSDAGDEIYAAENDAVDAGDISADEDDVYEADEAVTDADELSVDEDAIAESEEDADFFDEDILLSDEDISIFQDEDTSASDEDADVIEVPLDGFGAISGECGVLDDELVSESSFFFLNSIDFLTDPYDETDYPFLTAGGREILDDVNAGNAVYSKVFAYEMLARCEFAGLLKTESEIGYDPDTGRTDLLVNIDGLKIGVSVTKAVKYPFDAEYTVTDAHNLLTAKLTDIIESSKNVLPEDKWEKQVLHVIAYSDQHAVSLKSAYDSLDDTVRTDTIVMVTVSNGDDSFLY